MREKVMVCIGDSLFLKAFPFLVTIAIVPIALASCARPYALHATALAGNVEEARSLTLLVRSAAPYRTQQRSTAFIPFMSRFYPAYQRRDWAEMRSIARTTSDVAQHFDSLLDGAVVFARPGMRDSSFDWSRGYFLDSSDLVGIAVNLLASSRGLSGLTELRLTRGDAAKIGRVLGVLCSTAYSQSVAPFEASERLKSVQVIFTMLGDPAGRCPAR